MTVDDLLRALEPHTDADVTATYRRFRARNGTQEMGEFVDYMVKEGLLPEGVAAAVVDELASPSEPTVIEPHARRAGDTDSRPILSIEEMRQLS